MMQQEFEKLTKVKVTSEEYNVIEAAYMACQEDKQVFCKQWLNVLCKGGHMQWELVDGKLCDYESPNI